MNLFFQPSNLAECQKSREKRWKMKWDFIELKCELKAIRHPTVQSLTHKHHRAVISCIMAIMGMLIKFEFRKFPIDPLKFRRWKLLLWLLLLFIKFHCAIDLWINFLLSLQLQHIFKWSGLWKSLWLLGLRHTTANDGLWYFCWLRR